MRKDFKHARSENNKLIKNINLELTQLMEQGDHVTKSPWSNWQIGANDFYNDWHGRESNQGHKDFQSFALPTELWHRALFFLSGRKDERIFDSMPNLRH